MNCKENRATLWVDEDINSGRKANIHFSKAQKADAEYTEYALKESKSARKESKSARGESESACGDIDLVSSPVNTPIKSDYHADQFMEDSAQLQGKLQPPPGGNIRSRANQQQHSIDANYRVIKRQYNANKKQKNISKDTWDDLEVYIEDYCKRRSRRYGMDSMGKVYNVAWGLANGQSKCKSCTEKGIWKLYCPHMDYEYKIECVNMGAGSKP